MFKRFREKIFRPNDAKAGAAARVTNPQLIALLKPVIAAKKSLSLEVKLDLSITVVRALLSNNIASKTSAMDVDAGATNGTLIPLSDTRVVKLTGSDLAELKNDIQEAGITELNLEGHDICGADAESLVQVIRHNPQLKKVNVNGNPLGEVGRLILARAILNAAIDTRLPGPLFRTLSLPARLSFAAVYEQEAREAFMAEEQKIVAQTADLFEGVNGFNINAGSQGLSVAQVLSMMKKPYMKGGSTSLSIARYINFFAYQDSMTILSAFMAANNLREIDLSNVELFFENTIVEKQERDSFATALGSALAAQRNLEVLSLAENSLFARSVTRGIKFITTILNGAVALRELGLGKTGLNAGNIKKFAQALIAAQTKLTTLDLSGNTLTECMGSVVEIINAIPSSRNLLLNDCFLNDDDGIKLADGLKDNNALHALVIQKNQFGSDTVKALSAAVLNHRHMRELYVDGCGNGDNDNAQLIADLNTRDAKVAETRQQILASNDPLKLVKASQYRHLQALSIGADFLDAKTTAQLTTWLSAPHCQLRELAVSAISDASRFALRDAVRNSRTITYFRAPENVFDHHLKVLLDQRRRDAEQMERTFIAHWSDIAVVLAFVRANINNPFANSVLPLYRTMIQLIDLDPPVDRIFVGKTPAQPVKANLVAAAAASANADVVMADSKATSSASTSGGGGGGSASANPANGSASAGAHREILFFNTLFFRAHVQPKPTAPSASAAAAASAAVDVDMADMKAVTQSTQSKRKRKTIK